LFNYSQTVVAVDINFWNIWAMAVGVGRCH